MSRSAGSLSALAAGAALLGILSTAVIVSAKSTSDRTRRIESADARELLSETVRLARTGNFANLCQEVAARSTICRSLLSYTTSENWLPDNDDPTIVSIVRYPATSNSEESLVLHLKGKRADGMTYESDFPVIRASGGEVKSPAPIYWSGITFVGSLENCRQQDGEACGQNQLKLD